MDAGRPRGITRFFDDVQDPRMDRTRHHQLEDILMIGLWSRPSAGPRRGHRSNCSASPSGPGSSDGMNCPMASPVTWRITRDRWPGLKGIGRVVRQRTDRTTDKTTTTTVYYLMSQPMTAERFAAAVRGHWGIENSARWVLDVTFDEDRCRCRKNHGDQNSALMRRLAMNLLRANRDRTKLGMKAQRLKIGWDIDFLEDLLTHLG